MKSNKLLTSTAAAGLASSVNVYAAKEIKIALNNIPYSGADVQELAVTATGMDMKEPASLNAASGTATASGGSVTECTSKVGAGDMSQIRGVSCRWSAYQPNQRSSEKSSGGLLSYLPVDRLRLR